MMKKSTTLFMLTLMMGTMMSVSSSSWFGAWMGLEINLLSFIPMIAKKAEQRSMESALKYFIIQAVGSAMLITAALLSMSTKTMMMMSNPTIMIALLMKAGAAPMHFWFPGVMEGMSWVTCMLLMTWQKLAPLMLISYMKLSMIILSTAMVSSLVGALGGLNQTSLRKIMAYSSIGHMGWMLAATSISEEFWMTYMIVYSILSITVSTMFLQKNSMHLAQMFMPMKNKTMTMITSMNMLSLGGLPPFLGFMPKWMLMQIMVTTSPLTALVLIMSALVNLYYYLRVSLSAMVMSLEENKWTKEQTEQTNMMTMLMTIPSLSGMLVITLLWPKF